MNGNIRHLGAYEVRQLMRDIEDLNRDIKEYGTIYPSTIKTCEMLLANMKHFCSEEWIKFAEEQHLV